MGASAQEGLIPRETIFGNPERASVRISPDGKMISYLAPVDNVLNVWVAPADKPNEARAVTSDTDRGVRQYFWAYTNDRILYLQDRGGDENWQVFSVDVNTKSEICLTPQTGIAAQIVGVSDKFPDRVLLGVNDRGQRMFHDVHSVNIVTGKDEVVLENPGHAGYMYDDNYDPRFAFAYNMDASLAMLKRAGESWEPYQTIPGEDSLTTNPVGFNKDASAVYFVDSRGRDTAALISHDLRTGKDRVIFENSRADVSNVLMHPETKEILAVSTDYTRETWHSVGVADIDRDLAYLKSKLKGDVNVAAQSHDNTKWIVADSRDDGPVEYYFFDRSKEARTLTYLFANRPALKGLPLAKMHAIEIPARDGQTLVSYLSLPKHTDSDADGRPDKPLPLVLNVHGGPWARDSWGYHPEHQWLANRGYAVLSVNFRGSTGLGKSFINAANGEWSGDMHNDLLDAVEWAVKKKIALRDKVAIYGGSYGGYATLVGLTFTPDVFACGVDIVGPSSLVTLMENIPPYWYPIMPILSTRVGDPSTEEGRQELLARSPITHVQKIKKPLLIAQGANDPRVKQVEADQIVAAMKGNHIPVTYVLYPDEGHGFAKPQNRMSFYAITEAFLSEHLGGRFEPIGDDFSGSSVTVPDGAALVPGLADALK